MTEEQIVDNWFGIPENRATIPSIVYSEAVYNFIRTNADQREYGGDKYYKVFGSWYKIVVKKTS